MKKLIPHFIQEQYQAQARTGAFEAYTMFVDMSGFTRLTETLLQEGKTGAERLSVILNAIFAPMVASVYECGGFIPYFAGDAFTGIFPVGEREYRAEDILALAQRQFLLLKESSAHFQEFEIGIKVGLSFGRVEWGIVGETHLSFYFKGEAIEGCTQSQAYAKQQQVIVDRAFRQQLNENIEMEPVAGGVYFLVKEDKRPEMAVPASPADIPPMEPSIAARFLPDAVLNFNQQGEFRRVVSVFISFDGADTYEVLNEFATIVADQVFYFSGYFKEIDFSDKGGVLVIIFGAPVSFENNVERAIEFVCCLNDELHSLQLLGNLRYKVGIASGIAYTGIVGGEQRCQYAAVGNRVNIAARLMMKADWGEVLVDGEVQKSRHFRFVHKGDLSYKGLSESIPTYLLAGRSTEQRQSFDGIMVGRATELERLASFALEALDNSTAKVAYVYGEPGIGKTRLSFELRHRLRKHLRMSWLTCQSDQILRKPFNPFIFLLRNYFEQSSDNAPKANLANFEKHYGSLINALMQVNHPESASIKREIIRTKPVLAALVGLKTANSLWESLDAKGRYQNILAALTGLFRAEALLQPLVIELEDGHWFDDSSREFLKEFAGRIKHDPIFLLITSRYNDEGNKQELIPGEILDKYELPVMVVDLNILDTEAMHTFAAERLQGKVDESLVDLLMRTTNGNPFYAEQMLDYFLETGLLETNGQGWFIKDQNVGVSDSIHSVLTARIDRLSALVKETVKAAAVIGREFELPVLTEVMKEHEAFIEQNGNTHLVLKEQVQTAERAQIWQAMNELRYIFRHSLLREAVYDMQLKARLRELHRQIAEAIENLYADNLEQHYVDLAFHYEQAEVEPKLQEYLQKAADYAKEHFQNSQALQYYDKLLAILEKKNNAAEQAKTLLKKGSILELIGGWEEGEAIYRNALELARQTADSRLLGRANNSLGYLLMLKGNYDEADNFLETAAAFFGSIHDNRGTSKVYGNLGTLYFRQGKYEDAKLYFIRSIQLAQLYKHTPSNAQIVATLGLTYMNLGKYDDGIRWQKSQLDICKQVGDRKGMATLHTNMGIVYFEKGDYDEALACYQKGLTLAEELGDKQLVSIATGCIGNVWQRKGKFDLAMQHFEHDLALAEELGDKQGISIAKGLIGELYSVMGQFDKAIEYMQANLAITEELGYRKGNAKALNTLGDIYFYKKEYATSLDYYDRSIAVTRSIGNKLVLGFSLVEKGNVLLFTEKIDEARQHLEEAVAIAKDLNHPDLLYETKLLSAKILMAEGKKDEAKSLLEWLLEQPIGKRELAAAHYKLSKLEPDSLHKPQALTLYRELYQETPMFVFELRIKELEK